MMRIKYFTAPRKMPILCFLETLRRAPTEPNILWLPTPPENHFDSNRICFYSKLGKVFPLAEFQAKLFLTPKWVGGFYRDSLLKDQVTLRICSYLVLQIKVGLPVWPACSHVRNMFDRGVQTAPCKLWLVFVVNIESTNKHFRQIS